ncbi:24143_t:CDS:2 [Cetraspora pellucida]|uniref:Large ribosomal subunit protein uL30m n=1 Tax=Cetraspora pellucida TaxID=1433469 RepID=A0A9N9ADS5_9GLOM|nr:24143_t:CDS:2 [Cetraspora pellucida]
MAFTLDSKMEITSPTLITFVLSFQKFVDDLNVHNRMILARLDKLIENKTNLRTLKKDYHPFHKDTTESIRAGPCGTRLVIQSYTYKLYFDARTDKTAEICITKLKWTTLASHIKKGPTGFFKITLRRSPIGLPKKLRAVVKALGLSKLSQTVYHSQTPIIAGMILKVKELLEVKNVKKVPTPEERKHYTEPGYVVIKRYNEPVQV